MPDEREGRIEQILRSLAHEPIQARDEFKQHLIAVLHQEQRCALKRRAYWHAIGALVRQMRRVPAWAAVAVLLLLAVAITLIMRPSQRVFLTVHKGTASLVYYYPNSKHPLEQRESGVSPVMEGTRVSLDEHSAASIQLFDNSRVELFPSTQITLARAQPRSLWRPQEVRINLSAGELRAEVTSLRTPEEVFEVETPAALISVHGTVFHTRVVTPQHVYVATYEGLVLVTLADPAQGNPRAEVPAGCAVNAIIGLPLLVHCGEPEDSTMLPEGSIPSPADDVLATHSPVAAERYDRSNSTPPVGDIPTLLPEVTSTPPAITLSPGNKPPAVQVATVTATITPTWANEPADPITCTAPPPVATPIPVSTPPATPVADVAIEFTGFPSLASAEGDITYTLRVVNRGPARAQNVVAMDLLPLQASLVAASLAPEQEGNTLVWRLGALDAGAIRSWEVNVLVYPGAMHQFTNTVMVSSTTYDSDLSNNVAIASTAVTSAADLAVALAGIPPLIGSGSAITCTLSYTNAGPAVAQNVLIMTWLSDGLTFGGVVDGSPPPDSGAVSGGTLALGGLVPVVWRIPVLKAGVSGSIVFKLTARANFLGPVTTTVAITATSPDLREDNNFLTSTVNIVDPADLSIAHTIAPDPVVAGEEITCTLVYTNDGPGVAREVLITMTFPAGVTVGKLPGATAKLSHDERLLTWFIPALPAQMGGSLVLTLTVEQPIEGPLYGRIAISSVTPDSVPADNVSTWAINPLVAGLEVGHAVTPRLIAPHMPFTWTVYLTNVGTLSFPVRSLTVVPSLPPGFLPASSDERTVSGAKKSWHNTTTLLPGEALSLPLDFVATGDVVSGVYPAQVVVTATFPGGLLTATEAVSVSLALPSVKINQQAGATSGRVCITVCLTNTGPSALDLVPLYAELTPPPALAGMSPAPDAEVTAGALRWLDLTGLPPHGVGRDLRPGEVLTVTFVLSPPGVCIESRLVVGELRDVYGNRSDGSTSRMVLCTGSRLYLPLVLRQS